MVDAGFELETKRVGGLPLINRFLEPTFQGSFGTLANYQDHKTYAAKWSPPTRGRVGEGVAIQLRRQHVLASRDPDDEA